MKVDVDKSPEIARRFDARSIPTLLLMEHGQVVSRQVGAAPAHVLEQWVDSALAKDTARDPDQDRRRAAEPTGRGPGAVLKLDRGPRFVTVLAESNTREHEIGDAPARFLGFQAPGTA